MTKIRWCVKKVLEGRIHFRLSITYLKCLGPEEFQIWTFLNFGIFTDFTGWTSLLWNFKIWCDSKYELFWILCHCSKFIFWTIWDVQPIQIKRTFKARPSDNTEPATHRSWGAKRGIKAQHTEEKGKKHFKFITMWRSIAY